MSRPTLLACLGLAGLLGALPICGAQPYRYRRDVQVDQPGWVRVQVTLPVLTRLAASGEDSLLTDPSGAPLPVFPWVGPAEPAPMMRAVDLTEMRTVLSGWQVEADLGRDGIRHRMVLLDIPGTGLAEGVTLEASTDGKTWHLLARGSMFRLNRWGMTSKTYLEYAPTTDRYLRIFWPARAGFPAWKVLWVADWPEEHGEWAEEPMGFSPAWKDGGETCYRLEAPRSVLPAAALVLDVPVPYPLHARLLSARDGAWTTVAESFLMPDRTPLVPLPGDVFGRPLVLALGAGEFATPALKGVALRYPPRRILFNAIQPGTYTLWYGAMGRAGHGAVVGSLPSMPDRYEEAVLGPEREQALPDLPAPTLAAGAQLPDVAFDRRWTVRSDGSREHELVRLELPPELYEVARRDLADVRLACQGRQVPYVLWTPAEGAPVVALHGAAPQPSKDAGQSKLDLKLAQAWLPLTAVELSAPAAPFTRGVSLQYLRRANAEEGLRGDVWADMDQATWACEGAADAPARLTLRAGPVESRDLRLVFLDRDNAPLPALDVTLWRRRHVLIFPWPQGEVTLCAGARDLQAPSYDLEALKEDIIARPAAKAAAAPAEARTAGAASWQQRPAARWVFLGALLAAAIVLLLILSRAMRQTPAEKG